MSLPEGVTWKWDSEASAGYLTLMEKHGGFGRTVRLETGTNPDGPEVFIDVDEKGQLIGVEILK